MAKILRGLFLFSVMSSSLGLHVTVPEKLYEVARGDEATLTCSFVPQNPNSPLIIITWTGEPTNVEDEEITFGTYYSSTNHLDIAPAYEGKASMENDIGAGVSKLILRHVTLQESRDIKCQVQIPGDDEGQTSDTTSLLVLVAPSPPICRVQGTAQYGHNISLTCQSEEGSPTPTYQWQSYNVNNISRPHPPKATEKNGVLSLFNVSRDTSGYYICVSTNTIRSAHCNLTLTVMPVTMSLGSTATIVLAVGGVATAVLVIILIYCCCCRKRKDKAEEFNMSPPEVVEFHDEPVGTVGAGDGRKLPVEDRGRDPELQATSAGHTETTVRRFDDERKTGSADQLNHQMDHAGRESDSRSRDNNESRQDRSDDRWDRSDDRWDRSDDGIDRSDDRRDRYDDRQDRYDDRRDRYDDRRDRYDDRRDRYDDRRDRYDDRRGSYDDRKDRYDDRRGSYDDRQDRYDNGRDRYNARQDHYDDRRVQYNNHYDD